MLEEKATVEYRLYRGDHIFEMLNKIVKEQIQRDERFSLQDYVDISISNEGRSCICVVLAIKHLVKTKQNICHFIIMTDISRHPNEKQIM